MKLQEKADLKLQIDWDAFYQLLLCQFFFFVYEPNIHSRVHFCNISSTRVSRSIVKFAALERKFFFCFVSASIFSSSFPKMLGVDG